MPDFGSWIEKIEKFTPQTERNSEYEKGREALEKIAKAIEKMIGASGGAEVLLVPGVEVNYGQQYKIVARVLKRNYETTLFRVYIPQSGFPVTVDFYGEELESCDNPDELGERIYRFLEQSATQDNLRLLTELAQ